MPIIDKQGVEIKHTVSLRTRLTGVFGLFLILLFVYLFFSLRAGGRMAGPTYIAPGNVGLTIDTYHGNVQGDLMPAGTHWQGLWERVIEVPTAQRTLALADGESDGHGGTIDNSVKVNTISNILSVDVSAFYQIQPAKAADLYRSYQDQFADVRRFETTNLEPALKGAVNYAIGDMDTAKALTTPGKQEAETNALKTLNEEWGPRGIEFTSVMIRGIRQDPASQQLLSTTLAKMQDIENAKLALQQQQYDNATQISQATADAKVNRLQNAALTDLYVQDQLLSRVKRVYLPSDMLMGGQKR